MAWTHGKDGRCQKIMHGNMYVVRNRDRRGKRGIRDVEKGSIAMGERIWIEKAKCRDG